MTLDVFKNKLFVSLISVDFLLKIVLLITMNNGEEFTLLPFLRIQHFIDYYTLGYIGIAMVVSAAVLYGLILKFSESSEELEKIGIIFIVSALCSFIFDLVFLQGSFVYLNFINFKGQFYHFTISLFFIYIVTGVILYLVNLFKE